MTGADALVKCLQNEHVEYVFGYPGVAIAPFFNSILDTDLKTVLVRQEQNAAHSANGYARATGKVGVAAVTSGPGATNIITGIATAFADSIPIVVITGQVKSSLVGSDVFQEADICGACESFVKYSYIVRDARDIPRIMKEAFYIANSGRRGPVLIDIPIDVQQTEIKDFRYPEEAKLRTYKPTVQGNTVQIKKVFARLKEAKRPIICVGGGVHLARAVEAVRKFADNNRIPVVCTMMGIGVMKSNDPMFFGMVGNNGNSYGNRAMNEADMIIMVGARVADRSISQPDLITENKTLVHIDVDPAEIGKNAGPEIPLVGDIASVFEVFNQQECDSEYNEWVDRLKAYKKETEDKKLQKLLERVRKSQTVTPEEFIIELSQKLQDDAIYVADVGQNQMWSCGNYITRNGRFFTSGGMGTMGYSVPAALGAKLADKKKQVVAVIGDGAFQMCLMELATMRQYNVPVKIAVISNGWLGLVRQYQHFTYDDRFSVTDLSGSPDLSKIAEAYGIKYIRMENNGVMPEKLDAFLEKDESVLMEVVVDPSEIA